MQPSWFIDIIRELFFVFDKIVYNLIDLIYQLFMMIAETGIFRSEDIRVFAERIYFFLGLIMVFKVSISIIQFIANPDSAKDGKIGAPKLLKNLVVILVGIILIPYVFEAAYSLQRLVLKDNVIGNLILGMNYSEGSADDSDSDDIIKTAGKRMAFTTFTAFFHLNTDITGESETGIFSNACSTNPFLKDGTINPECSEEAEGKITEFMGKKKNANFQTAYSENNFNYLGRMQISYEIEDTFGDDQYMFDYSILISTAAGVFVIWILLGFCVDIAIRNVKLGFLQLIAPIPLIAKVDPQKGDEIFNKWVKECTSTYLSLFARLVAIYFAVFLLSLITGGFINVVDGEESSPNIFVKVFFIFGILTFAKDLPNVLKKLFPGLELDGKGLGLKNKLNQTPLVGAAANKALGLAGRTGLNLAKGLGRATGKGIGKGARAIGNKTGLSSWASDPGRWFNKAGTGIGKGVATLGRGARKVGNAVNSATGGAMGNIGSDAGRTFGAIGANVADQLGFIDRRIKSIDDMQAEGRREIEANNLFTGVVDNNEKRAREKIENGEAGELSTTYLQRKQHLENNKAAMEELAKTKESRIASGVMEERKRQSEAIERSMRLANPTLSDQQIKDRAEQQVSSTFDSAAIEDGLRRRFDADMETAERQLAEETKSFNKWFAEDATYEYIDKSVSSEEYATLSDADKATHIKDDVVVNNNRQGQEIANSYGYQYAASSKTRHGDAGKLKGRNSEIQTEFTAQDKKKRELQDQKKLAGEMNRK